MQRITIKVYSIKKQIKRLLFVNTGIDKRKCHYHKNPIFIDDVHIDKIFISYKVSLVWMVINTLFETELMRMLQDHV